MLLRQIASELRSSVARGPLTSRCGRCALAAALALGAVATGGKAAHAQLDPLALYNQQFWLLTHNSYANRDAGFLPVWENQRRSVYQQLKDGVRVINLDIWLVKQKQVAATWHFLYFDTATAQWKASDPGYFDIIYDFSDVTPEIVTGHEIPHWSYLLLKGLGTGNGSHFRNLKDSLWQIQRFLSERPDAVVTISFESYLPEGGLLRSYFQETGLLDRIFYADRPNSDFFYERPGVGTSERVRWEVKKHGWPRVQDLVDHRRNLIVFTDNPTTSDHRGDDLPSYDDYVAASAGGAACRDPQRCNEHALGSADLFDHTINLFEMGWTDEVVVLDGENFADDRNDAARIYRFWEDNHFFTPGTRTLNPQCGRVPNFLSVDVYDIGGKTSHQGPLQTQPWFQNLWNTLPDAPTYIRRVRSSQQPVNGWYHDSVTLDIANFDVNNLSLKSNWVKISASQMMGANGLLSGENQDQKFLEYTGADQETVPYTVNAEGRTLVTYFGINKFGRNSLSKAKVVQIDRTPPQTLLVTYVLNSQTPDRQKQVVLSASDAASGIDSTFYQLDGGSWTRYTQELSLGPGLHTIRYYSVDKAGWTETTHTSTVLVGDLSSDRTAPQTTFKQYAGGSTLGPVLFVEMAAQDIGDFQSGVNATFFRLDFGPWQTYSQGWLMNEQGWHTIEYYSVDVAGNREEIKQTDFFVGLDITAPLTTASTRELGDLMEVTLTAADGGNAPSPPIGIRSTEFIVDGTQAQPYLGPFHLTRGRHAVTFRSTDRANNIEEWRAQTIVQGPLDVTNSYITAKPGSLRFDRATGLWKQPVTITNVHPTETVAGPISLVVQGLPSGIRLENPSGITANVAPTGLPYQDYISSLAPGASATITLTFRKSGSSQTPISYTGLVLAYPGNR